MSKKKEMSIEEKLKDALIEVEEQPYQLPENWEWCYLSTIFDVGSSKRVHQSDWLAEGVPFYRTREIVKLSKEGYVDNQLFISEEMYEEYKEKFGVPEISDLLVSGVGTIGISYVVKNKSKFYFKDGNVLWLKNKKISNPYFIDMLFKTTYICNQLKDMSKGSTVDTYTIINAKRTKIPLPPLAEQNRIVEKLDSMLGKIKEAKELIAEARETFQNRRAAILDRAFRGELTEKWRAENEGGDATLLLEKINEEKMKKWEEECLEAEKNGKKKPSKPKLSSPEEMLIPEEEQPYQLPEGWQWVRLGGVTKIKGGKRIPKGEGFIENYKANPYIRVTNFENGGVNLETIKYVSDEVSKKINNYRISSKDIYISIAGTIGKVGIIPKIIENAHLTENAAKITEISQINQKCLNLILETHTIKDIIENSVVSSGQPKLALFRIENFPIPLPPLAEQEEIVKIVETLLKAEEEVADLLDMESSIELLEKSILDKAFRGELGTGDESDEPALEMLKRRIEKE